MLEFAAHFAVLFLSLTLNHATIDTFRLYAVVVFFSISSPDFLHRFTPSITNFFYGEFMRLHNTLLASLVVMSFVSVSAFAAKAIDLRDQPVSVLQNFFTPASSFKQMKSNIDFTHTSHIRFQQMYHGHPVWGADAVMHVPEGGVHADTLQKLSLMKNSHATMNGIIYQNLEADLNHAPLSVFDAPAAEKALQHAIQLHEKKSASKNTVAEPETSLIVYVDQHDVAHWAFYVKFLDTGFSGLPQKPAYILDAMTLDVYEAWNDLKTLDNALGGGSGGNKKMGKITYDGLADNFPSLNIQRDPKTKICYLQNSDVTVKDNQNKNAIMQFACFEKSKLHNNIYWSADFDAINGAYSPGNDALYIGEIIKDMYQKWYGIPVLTLNDKPMMLNMIVHEKMENAYWDGKQMSFGDGGKEFYPLVSLGVGAHEISHGFTEQHSNLEYYGQSGGMNEAFSDMAAQAAEYYSTGKNTWQIGSEIMKEDNQALRYMDEPTKDCLPGDKPGNECSISNVKDYSSDLDVHYSSGVFNKMFYLLSQSPNWGTKKAFDVMVFANANYWTATSNFSGAACGVIEATKKYGYKIDDVMKAFSAVGVDTTRC
jgi:pseudolysin